MQLGYNQTGRQFRFPILMGLHVAKIVARFETFRDHLEEWWFDDRGSQEHVSRETLVWQGNYKRAGMLLLLVLAVGSIFS